MSTRTSSLALALVLMGCGAEAPRLALADRTPRTVQALYGGAVLVRAPEGYCVDPAGTRPRDGVAVLASCARLGGAGAAPATNGSVTVEVGAAGSASVAGNEAALSRMLGGTEGLAQLGSPGRRVAVAETAPGLVILRLEGAGREEEWRAFVDVAGRLASIGVQAREGATLEPVAALRLLEAAIVALQAANAPATGTSPGV